MVLCASVPAKEAAWRRCCCCCLCACHTAAAAAPAAAAAAAAPAVSTIAASAAGGSAAKQLSATADSSKHDSSKQQASATLKRLSGNSSSSSSGSSSSGGFVHEEEGGCEDCSSCCLVSSGRCRHQPSSGSCRCGACCNCSCFAPTPRQLARLKRLYPILSKLPRLDRGTNEEYLADALAQSNFPGSFVWASEASPCGYARLCFSGFLPVAEAFKLTASPEGDPVVLLLPKLHVERSCLLLKSPAGSAPASKNLRRKSSGLILSLDKAFDQVLDGCVRRHGENWLWKPVRQPLSGVKAVVGVRRSLQCFKALHRRTLQRAAMRQAGGNSSLAAAAAMDSTSIRRTQCESMQQQQQQEHLQRETQPLDVELHSFEVWAPMTSVGDLKLLPLVRSRDEDEAEGGPEKTGEQEGGEAGPSSAGLIREADPTYKDLCLVAGELGVSIGRVYTSLTGFTDADSAGSVQIAATRLLLRRAGYKVLDLGMHMPYKESLGAQPLPRSIFLKLFRKCRAKEASPLDETVLRCCAAASAAAGEQQEQRQAAARSAKTSAKVRKEKCGQGERMEVKHGPDAAASPAAGSCSRRQINVDELPPGFIGCRELLQMLGSAQKEATGSSSISRGITRPRGNSEVEGEGQRPPRVSREHDRRAPHHSVEML